MIDDGLPIEGQRREDPGIRGRPRRRKHTLLMILKRLYQAVGLALGPPQAQGQGEVFVRRP